MAALRYRAFSLYGVRPAGEPEPTMPEGYPTDWADMPDPVGNVEKVLRQALARHSRDRVARACREIGWLFSGWLPDPTAGL
jgi:hypothetical protein